MTLPRLLAGLALSCAVGCASAPRKTTPAFDEQPLGSVAVLYPTNSTAEADAPKILAELWRDQLAKRGWAITSPDQASAILHSSVNSWNFVARELSARVSIEAQLLRASDGALLWRDQGFGTDDTSRERLAENSPPFEEGESILDSAVGWAAGTATRKIADSLRLDSIETDFREAAADAIADALFSLPPPSRDASSANR